jgi:hypothetical protein
MSEDLAEVIRAIPEEAFREPRNPLENLTHLERLRWLEQTAYFIWKHKDASSRGSAPLDPGRTV